MPDRDDDIANEYLTYGRPSTASWVAAAAVAVAVFVLGGFIKTARQMEALRGDRNELSRENAELRREIDLLRQTAQHPALRPPPAARPRKQQDRNADRSPRRADDNRPGLRPGMAETDAPARGVTYSIGRTSKPSGLAGAEAGLAASGGDGGFRSSVQRQVISGGKKRLLIEGGADIGLREEMRLELRRQGRWIGEIRVVEAFATMSVCDIVHATRPPQPGDAVLRPDG